MKSFQIFWFATATELARAVADRWLEVIGKAASLTHIALSGGRIAEPLFAALVEGATRRKISFGDVHFFWADERCVPPSSDQSNYFVANQCLFRPLDIPPHNIHRIPGEKPPAEAADLANADVLKWLPPSETGVPVFDLIFLGVGEDGHVASLFPESSSVETDVEEPYCAVTSPSKPPPHRVTLTYRPLALASLVTVLAAGPGKADALLRSVQEPMETPLGRVLRSRLYTEIYTDVVGLQGILES